MWWKIHQSTVITHRHIFIWSRKWWVIQVSILIFLKLLENVFDEYSYGNSKQLFIVNSMFIRQIWYLNHHMALPLPDHVFGQMIGHLITCVGVESLFISRIDIQWRIKVQSNSISLNSQKPRSPYSNIISQISNKMSKTRLIALIGDQYSKIQVDIIRWKMASWRPMTKWTFCSSRQRRHENGFYSDRWCGFCSWLFICGASNTSNGTFCCVIIPQNWVISAQLFHPQSKITEKSLK